MSTPTIEQIKKAWIREKIPTRPGLSGAGK